MSSAFAPIVVVDHLVLGYVADSSLQVLLQHVQTLRHCLLQMKTQTTADLSWTENGAATSWDAEVVAMGAAATGTATDPGVSIGFTKKEETGLTAATTYDFYVRADCGGGLTSAYVVMRLLFSTLIEPCVDPTDLAMNNITTTDAEISWTENGTATVWDLEILTAGTAPTGVATDAGVSNPYTKTGLTPSTAYDVYLRADCGGNQSNWVGPVTFTTLDVGACVGPFRFVSRWCLFYRCRIKLDRKNGTAVARDLEILPWLEPHLLEPHQTTHLQFHLQ